MIVIFDLVHKYIDVKKRRSRQRKSTAPSPKDERDKRKREQKQEARDKASNSAATTVNENIMDVRTFVERNN